MQVVGLVIAIVTFLLRTSHRVSNRNDKVCFCCDAPIYAEAFFLFFAVHDFHTAYYLCFTHNAFKEIFSIQKAFLFNEAATTP